MWIFNINSKILSTDANAQAAARATAEHMRKDFLLISYVMNEQKTPSQLQTGDTAQAWAHKSKSLNLLTTSGSPKVDQLDQSSVLTWTLIPILQVFILTCFSKHQVRRDRI